MRKSLLCFSSQDSFCSVAGCSSQEPVHHCSKNPAIFHCIQNCVWLGCHSWTLGRESEEAVPRVICPRCRARPHIQHHCKKTHHAYQPAGIFSVDILALGTRSKFLLQILIAPVDQPNLVFYPSRGVFIDVPLLAPGSPCLVRLSRLLQEPRKGACGT